MRSGREPVPGFPVLGALLAGCIALFAGAGAPAQERHAESRRAMVEQIVAMVRAMGSATGETRIDPRVIEVMGRVPRHEFVPAGQVAFAYENRPLPIGHGQTISQPYIVAVMSELMRVGADDAVLEIGTGSGYQAAVLAELGAKVSTIEIIEPLALQAAERLRRLGYANVRARTGDGYHGWPEHGPFDAIMVTAAAAHVPPPLVRQLKPGGRMVIPVGPPFLAQHLVLVEKREDGSVSTRQLLPVRFVPLTGGH